MNSIIKLMSLLIAVLVIQVNLVSQQLQPKPTLIQPANNGQNMSIQPSFYISSTSTASYIEWQVSTDSSFSSIYKTGKQPNIDSIALTSAIFALGFDKSYNIRARYCEESDTSEWSNFQTFTTLNKPSILSPSNNTTLNNRTFEVEWIANEGQFEIQISEDSTNFANAYTQMINFSNSIKTSYQTIQFETSDLNYNTTYECRIRQYDEILDSTSWSDIIIFTTGQSPSPPLLGSTIPNASSIYTTPLSEVRTLSDNSLGSIEGTLNVNQKGGAEYSIPIWSPPGTNGVKPEISLTYNSQSGEGLAGWGWHLSGLSSISRTPKSKYLDGETEELELSINSLLSLDGNRLITTDEGSIQNQGHLGTHYTTLQGNNVRVVHVDGNTSNESNLISHFKVTDKQNNISYYGGTPNSKLKMNQNGGTYDYNLSWRINRQEDIYGNFVEYIYEDDYLGMNLIKEISYGSSNQPAYAKIVFEYVDKIDGNTTDDYTDQSEFYIKGFTFKNSKVLKNIIIKYEDVEVKRYKLDYIFDDVSYLYSIQEFGKLPLGSTDPLDPNRKRTNETIFDYEKAEISVKSINMGNPVLSLVPNPGERHSKFDLRLGDFNGDGIKDRIVIDKSNATVYFHMQFGQYFECEGNDNFKCDNKIAFINPDDNLGNPNDAATNQFSINSYLTPIDYSNIIISDINNDGRDELLIPYYDDYYNQFEDELKTYYEDGHYEFSNQEYYKKYKLAVYASDGNHLWWQSTLTLHDNRAYIYEPFLGWNEVVKWYNDDKLILGDYDGDGFKEIILSTAYHYQYYHDLADRMDDKRKLIFNELVEENGDFKQTTQAYEIFSHDWGNNLDKIVNKLDDKFQLFDAIQNGKDEILIAMDGNLSTQEGIYELVFDANQVPSMSKVPTSSKDLDYYNTFVGDFNGDGYSDILYRKEDKKWYVSYWNGIVFSQDYNVKELEDHNYSNPININMLLLGDIDGNGKTEILKIIDKIDIDWDQDNNGITRWISYLKSRWDVLSSYRVGEFYSTNLFEYRFKLYDYETGENPGKEFLFSKNTEAYELFSIINSPASMTKRNYYMDDFNGDGNVDIYNWDLMGNKINDTDLLGNEFVNADLGGGDLIMFNLNKKSRLLKNITDGYDNKINISYKPIASGEVSGNPNNPAYPGSPDEFFRKNTYYWDNTLNNGAGGISYDLRPMNNGLWLVNSVNYTKSKKTIPEKKIDYSYGYSIFSKELGFLGFKEFFTRSYDAYDSPNYTESREYFNPYIDNPNKIITIIPDRTETHRWVDSWLETENTYETINSIPSLKTFDDGNYMFYQTNIVNIDHHNETRSQTSFTYDNFLNPLTEETYITDYSGSTNITRTKKEIEYGSYGVTWGVDDVPNKATKITNESEVYNDLGELPFITVTKYNYLHTAPYYLTDIISHFGLPKSVTTTFSLYDSFGNYTVKTLSPTSLPAPADRVVSYKYDSKGRFLVEETNSIGSQFMYYDEVFGNIESTKDVQENITFATYDEFGRGLTETDTYLNSVTTYRQWYLDDPNTSDDDEIVYYIHTEVDNAPDNWKYYDGWGNLLKAEVESFRLMDPNTETVTNDIVVTDYKYHADGRNYEVTYPYFINETPNPAKIITTFYDDYLRTKKIIDQGRKTETFYHDGGKRITRVETPDLKYSKVKTNEAGQTIESEDNLGGKVFFTYKNDLQSKIITTKALKAQNDQDIVMTIDFDIYGNKIKVDDKDAGIFEYGYNPYGELVWEKNDNGNSGISYDVNGRITQRTDTTYKGTPKQTIESISFTYVTNQNGIGEVETVSGPGTNDQIVYGYNPKGQLTSKNQVINGQSFLYSYDYLTNGLLDYTVLPSLVIIKNHYDQNTSTILKVSNEKGGSQNLWKIQEQDEYGAIVKYRQTGTSNDILNEIVFDEFRMPKFFHTSTDNGNTFDVQNWELNFNESNGNLISRYQTKKIGGIDVTQKEVFGYDGLDRLLDITYQLDQNPPYEILTMDYLADGSIENKSDVGDYYYKLDQNNNGVNDGTPQFPYHGIKQIKNSLQELQGHHLTLTSFNSVKTITSNCDYFVNFNYGPDYQRHLMQLYYKGLGNPPGALQYSKYYLDNYEKKEMPNGDYKEVSYIETPSGIVSAVVSNWSSNVEIKSLYFIHSDYLGSVEKLSNEQGQPIEGAHFSYGAWGELRNPDNWNQPIQDQNNYYFEIFDRGYTGHEHIKEFNLINMNGRIYDQTLGQFIQPDNNISFPTQQQAYNRYSYVLNNPMKFTDPSGEHLTSHFPGERKNPYTLQMEQGIYEWDLEISDFSTGTWVQRFRAFGSDEWVKTDIIAYDPAQLTQEMTIQLAREFGGVSITPGYKNSGTDAEKAKLLNDIAKYQKQQRGNKSSSSIFDYVVDVIKNHYDAFMGNPIVYLSEANAPYFIGGSERSIEEYMISDEEYEKNRIQLAGLNPSSIAKRLRRNAAKGADGERRVGVPKKKKQIKINGRSRYPDHLTAEQIIEVKNVQSLGFTKQLRDYLEYANSRGLDFILYTPHFPNGVEGMSGPLRKAIKDGLIIHKYIPGL